MKKQLLFLFVLLISYSGNAQFAAPDSYGLDFFRAESTFNLSDIDNDGDIDIIASGPNIDLIELGSDFDTKIYRNDGSGNFIRDDDTATTNIEAIDNGIIKFADVDGDLDMDLFMAGYNEANTRISKLYINDGTGSFTLHTNSSATIVDVLEGDATFGDIDGDLDIDLIVMGSALTGHITEVYLNDGSGNFTTDAVASATIENTIDGEVELVDIDNDDDLDVVIAGNFDDGSFFRKTPKLYRNNGTGVFTEDVNATANMYEISTFGSLTFFDMDCDGDLDVVYGGQGQGIDTNATTFAYFLTYENDGLGNFSNETILNGSGFFGESNVADFDGDGDLDIITSGEQLNGFTFSEIYYNTNGVFNDLPGLFYEHQDYDHSKTAVADLNNDDRVDVVIFEEQSPSLGPIFINESPYKLPQEIDVLGNNVSIPNGNTNTSITDNTDFGELLCSGLEITKQFTITNTGEKILELTGDMQNHITLNGSSDFSIVEQPTQGCLSPGDSLTFSILYMSSTGISEATVSIENNDEDEPLYTFIIKGEVVSPNVSSNIEATACEAETIITVSHTEVGLNYFLRNDADDSIIAGPVEGNGGEITFNTGTISSTTTFNVFSEVIDEALVFDGVDEYVLVQDAPQINPSNALTLETWVKIDNLGERTYIINKPNDNPSALPFYQYHLEIRPSGEIYFPITLNGTRYILETSGFPIVAGEWQHIAGTWDGITMTIYKNGVAYGTTTTTPANSLSVFSTNLGIGANVGTNAFTPVTINDVRIWNIARSASEIQSHYNQSLIGDETGLVAYYDFNEGSGTVAIDKTSNANNGTLINMESPDDWVPFQFNPSCIGELENKITITVNQIFDFGASITQNEFCNSGETTINIFGQLGVDYYLRNANDQTVISGPFPGSDAALALDTGIITTTTTFEIYAEAPENCSLVFGLTPTLTIINNCTVLVSPKIYLTGPSISGGLMSDALRTNNFLPTTSPYTDGLIVDAAVFNTTGSNAIVDWVWVELRDETDNTVILASQSALLQRDGDVVDLDGISNLSFTQSVGNYYIVINHRNHLGVMSLNPISLSETTTSVDFTSTSLMTYGSNAQRDMGSGILGLWAGDASGNGQIRFLGPGNDLNNLKGFILSDPGNSSGSTSYPVNSYSNADINLNGQARFLGPGNDNNILKSIILANPANTNGSTSYPLSQQIPN